MAAVTICSDFGAQKNKVWHCFHCFPIYFPWSDDYTIKCHLQIQCDPHQITNDIFHRARTKKFTIHMETQKTLNSQSRLEKEEWSWRNQPSWLQVILQSYSQQDSMVLVRKQKYSPMEQGREPRDKPMHRCIPYFWQRRQEYTMGQRQPLQQMLLGKLDSYM